MLKTSIIVEYNVIKLSNCQWERQNTSDKIVLIRFYDIFSDNNKILWYIFQGVSGPPGPPGYPGLPGKDGGNDGFLEVNT